MATDRVRAAPASASDETARPAGYLANRVQPRLFMTTHMPFDPYVNEESVAEICEHWKGPFHFGAPDGVVVNVTKEQLWVREGILPDYPNSRAPQFDFTNGQLVVPLEALPESLKQSMGAAWRLKLHNLEILEAQGSE